MSKNLIGRNPDQKYPYWAKLEAKEIWLADLSPPSEILLVETAMSKNLVGQNLDQKYPYKLQKYPYCSFDPADIQSINQTIFFYDSSLRERE
jgi:hypothetical protein